MRQIKKFLGRIIWDTSGVLGISLGKAAPIILGWMIGSKGHKVN